MSADFEHALRSALALSEEERAALVDELLASFGRAAPDPRIAARTDPHGGPDTTESAMMRRLNPSPPSDEIPDAQLPVVLFEYFLDYGYLRRSLRRRQADRSVGFGAWAGGHEIRESDEDWEVRFVLDTAARVEPLRRLLVRAGFTPGPPFRARRETMLPLHGRRAYAWFEDLWEQQRRPARGGS